MDTIDEAFENVRRTDFLPAELAHKASYDMPLPIGYGQTNSQPSTVRMMLEWLEPEPGNKVLDVGSGSGWTTALLARIVGSKGKVYAVEAIPELVEFGRGNVEKADIKNAEFFETGSVLGLPKYAPYDRILISADSDELPSQLVSQLKPGGKMVIPVRGSVLEVEKLPNGELDITPHHGFMFVPLVKPDDADL